MGPSLSSLWIQKFARARMGVLSIVGFAWCPMAQGAAALRAALAIAAASSGMTVMRSSAYQ